jgi:hypothetical protein
MTCVVQQAGGVSPFPLIDELPEVELQAVRLDGEAYRLGEGYVPIGVAPVPATRAIAALGTRTPRLVAALGTAAWIWGATPHPPARGEFLVDLAARWRPPFGGGPLVIESHLRPGDVVRWGEASVTSTLRTAVDLARFRTHFGENESAVVRRLAEIGGFEVDAALHAMNRGRNLAGKRAAGERLREALSRS